MSLSTVLYYILLVNELHHHIFISIQVSKCLFLCKALEEDKAVCSALSTQTPSEVIKDLRITCTYISSLYFYCKQICSNSTFFKSKISYLSADILKKMQNQNMQVKSHSNMCCHNGLEYFGVSTNQLCTLFARDFFSNYICSMLLRLIWWCFWTTIFKNCPWFLMGLRSGQQNIWINLWISSHLYVAMLVLEIIVHLKVNFVPSFSTDRSRFSCSVSLYFAPSSLL